MPFLVNGDLSIDDDEMKTRGIGMRPLESGDILHGGRIEDDDIRIEAGLEQATIL